MLPWTSGRASARRRVLVVVQSAALAVTLTIAPASPAVTPASAAGTPFASLTCSPTAALPISASTGEKPQSKVWLHDGAWWAVLPTTAASPGSGTWLWKLVGSTWTSVLKLSNNTDTHADVTDTGTVAHVLLYRGASSELASIAYAGGTYALWPTRTSNAPVTLTGATEPAATIALDSAGRLWVAWVGTSDVWVSSSISPYSAWSAPTSLASGMPADDIAVITAMPGNKIGVLWSNENAGVKRFGFRTHVDGDPQASWTADEVPASGSAHDSIGTGMADDHLNVAVASDGTLYAAVKTSYDTAGYPKMALLVRRPNGTWDPLYGIDEAGTRPIVLLNEPANELLYVYTSAEGYNNTVYRTSSTSSISFGARQTLITGGVNDTTSTKQNYTNDIVILASSATNAQGVHCTAAAPVNHVPVAGDDGYTTAQDTAKTVAAPGVLGNDTDADGDTLTAAKVAGPSHGTATLSASGGFTYTPAAGYTGDDSFTYKASDGQADSNTATVSITVTPAGGDPSLVGHWTMDETSGTTAHDTGAAPANDATTVAGPTFGAGKIGNALTLNGSTQYATAPDEASLDITGAITMAAWIKPESTGTEGIVKKGVTGGSAGYELSLGSSGKVFVRFNGQAAYRVDSATSYPTDGNTWVHVAGTYDGTTVKLYYNGVSENPKAASFGLLSNTYPLSIGVNGDLTQYFFDGAIDDVRVYNRALSDTEIAALAAAAPVNHVPVAGDDGYTTAQDTAKTVAAPGVLGNDTDADGDTLTAAKVAGPSHGTATLSATGGFTYTPAAGYTGDDSFTYKASDGQADSNTATVSITVTPAGGDPSLVGHWTMDETSGTTAHDTGAAPANDATTVAGPTFGAGKIGNALTLNGSTQYATAPDEASLDITGAITMAAWIKPGVVNTQDLIAKDINGSVNGYQLSLSTTKTDASSRKVFVRFNQAASGDAYRINSTTEYPIDGTWIHVAATWDGTTIRLYYNGVEEASLPFTGPIAANNTALGIGAQPDGARALFTGAMDDVRVYSRALSAAEIAGLADASPVNEAPVCSGVALTTPLDTAGDAAPSCTDANGDPLTYAIVGAAGHGTASVVAGQLHYVPAAGYTGGDSFTYRASDGSLDSNTATVTVTVTAAVTNYGLQLNGTSQYVTFGPAPGLDAATFTLETWFKWTGGGTPASTGSSGLNAIPLLTKGMHESDGSNVDLNWFLGIDAASGKLAADFEDTNTGLNHPVTASTAVTANVWHHAAATYDGSTWKLYLDGKLDGTLTISPCSPANVCVPRSDSIEHAGLGTALNSTGTNEGYFAGVLDEARVWSVARSQADIQATMDQELTGGTGLVARWGMNEGSGTSIASSVGTFPGTLTSGPAWVAGFVPPVNEAPVCSDVALTTPLDTAGDAAPSCTDANGDPLTYAIVGAAGHGTASVVAGQLHYVPAAGYTGGDSFTYRASDGSLDSNTATVTVTVTAAVTNYGLQLNGTSQYVTFGPAPGLDAATFTLETWFKWTGGGTSSTTGTGGIPDLIPLLAKGAPEVDSHDNRDADYILGIRLSTAHLAADFEEGAAGTSPSLNHPVEGSTAVTANVWHHAAATYDGSTWKLYLDGTLDGTLAVGQPTRADSIQWGALGTMLTSTGATNGFFAGVLDEARVWSVARSQADIQATMDQELTGGTGLVARWGMNEGSGTSIASSVGTFPGTLTSGPAWVAGAPFPSNAAPNAPALVSPGDGGTGLSTSPTLDVTVTDPDANDMSVTFYGRPVTAAAAPDFTIVTLPDTQNYTTSTSGAAIFNAQTQWIVDSLGTLNTKVASHLGDTVNDQADASQWTHATGAMAILDGASVPYGISPGNHDLCTDSGCATYNAGPFDAAFPLSKYSAKSWYTGGGAGAMAGREYRDSYQLFSDGSLDFIVINLEVNPPSDVVAWADGLLTTYASRQAIIVTHDYLTGSGTRSTVGGGLWTNLVSGHCNVFMVLSGHASEEAQLTSTRAGSCQPVYQVLQDYQGRTNGGDGWLRYYTFKPSLNRIDAFTWKVPQGATAGSFETDANSQFSLAYPMSGTSSWQVIGTATGVHSGDHATVSWNGLASGTPYEWYATVE